MTRIFRSGSLFHNSGLCNAVLYVCEFLEKRRFADTGSDAWGAAAPGSSGNTSEVTSILHHHVR
jgi:hypothetical protein